MARAFEQYHPTKVTRHTMPEETVENLKEALGSTDAPTAPPAG